MPEVQYQDLPEAGRREALQAAALLSGRRIQLLEKDIWIVATLGVLFEASFGRHLVFKGGTSLSKVWRAIRRFSEDIDITYDIRDFAPELVAGGGEEALPPTRSQERRWTRVIRPRLAEWVRDIACPLVEKELDQAGFAPRVRAEAEQLYVAYDPLFKPIGPVRPEVRVDFGARSTGDPHTVQPVVCDASAVLADTARRVLAEDYASMLPTGILRGDDERFDMLMQRCAVIEERANAASTTDR